MSAEYTSNMQILGHGGLKPLIRLLSSPDSYVKKNSIECGYHLVQVRLIPKNVSWPKLIIEFDFPLKNKNKNKKLKTHQFWSISSFWYFLAVIFQR